MLNCTCFAVFRRHRLGAFVLFGGSFLAIVGCGVSETKPDPAKQATVSGSVTKGGKAIALDSNITFFCEELGAQAGGKIDSLGKFSLTGAESKHGIPAGRYKVMIRPPVKSVAMAPSSAEYQQMMMQGSVQKDAAKKNESDLPIELQALESTKLIFEVKAGPNVIDIDLDKLNF
jgi:hypothetical protein